MIAKKKILLFLLVFTSSDLAFGCKLVKVEKINVVCFVIIFIRDMFQYGDRRLNFVVVYNMACLGTGRLCARVEKLCSLGKNGPVKRKNLNIVSKITGSNQQARISFHSFQVKVFIFIQKVRKNCIEIHRW